MWSREAGGWPPAAVCGRWWSSSGVPDVQSPGPVGEGDRGAGFLVRERLGGGQPGRTHRLRSADARTRPVRPRSYGVRRSWPGSCRGRGHQPRLRTRPTFFTSRWTMCPPPAGDDPRGLRLQAPVESRKRRPPRSRRGSRRVIVRRPMRTPSARRSIVIRFAEHLPVRRSESMRATGWPGVAADCRCGVDGRSIRPSSPDRR